MSILHLAPLALTVARIKVELAGAVLWGIGMCRQKERLPGPESMYDNGLLGSFEGFALFFSNDIGVQELPGKLVAFKWATFNGLWATLGCSGLLLSATDALLLQPETNTRLRQLESGIQLAGSGNILGMEASQGQSATGLVAKAFWMSRIQARDAKGLGIMQRSLNNY